MRYRLPCDRLINQLVPHYLPGRKFILFLQSLVYPLQTSNDRFVEYAKERRIEAAMTSQVLYFEWYLNRKFGKYLVDPSQRIFLSETSPIGVDLYFESAVYSRPFTVWFEGEQLATTTEEENPRIMHLLSEEKSVNKVSFTVNVPEINIAEHEFVYMLSHVVNTYKLAGKTYLIKIESKEIQPNKATK